MSYSAGQTGACPHCKVGVRFESTSIRVGGSNHGRLDPILFNTPSDYSLKVRSSGCPACGRPILVATSLVRPGTSDAEINTLLWPDGADRPIPTELESEAPQLAVDFREAVAVLSKSKKASAALSRRCLQAVLTSKGRAKGRDLSAQIESVLEDLPRELAMNVDAIRHVGNFAAHPLKSTSTGEIVPVEDGEAEWVLDVLEQLFEYYFVAPAQAAARRKALNKKLEAMGKPPLKTPTGADE